MNRQQWQAVMENAAPCLSESARPDSVDGCGGRLLLARAQSMAENLVERR